MKCYYHTNKEAGSQCQSCGKNLCEQCCVPGENNHILCIRCHAKAAADDVVSGIDNRRLEKNKRQEEKDLRKYQLHRLNRILRYGILLLGLVVLAVKIPVLFNSFEEKQPLRNGTYETDVKTDECIKILWNISKLIQEGKTLGDEYICPKSGKPFEIIETDSNIIARSPSPDLYGLKDIRVSKNNPVPELIK